jgi:hypothetical protein
LNLVKRLKEVNTIEKQSYQQQVARKSDVVKISTNLSIVPTPTRVRDGDFGIYIPTEATSNLLSNKQNSDHLKLCIPSPDCFGGKCPSCQKFMNFRGALKSPLHKLTAYYPKEAMQMLSYFPLFTPI